MGILIAIDGVDASGKQTQTEKLFERLKDAGVNVRMISFPAYDKPSSVLVKEYLNGDYGKKAEDVNAYAASVLFAADRFSTFKKDWIEDYNNGVVIIADRYVSSNMIHQAGKISDVSEKDAFLDWVWDLEFKKFELPEPEKTIFLDMPTEYGLKLMANRNNKITGEEQKDIHEDDREYMKKSYDNAFYVAKKFGWTTISCVKDGEIRTNDEINDEIYDKVIENITT